MQPRSLADRLRAHAPVLAAVALALAWRLPHLGWGLPAIEEEALPAKKALEMGGFGTGFTLDPGTAGWPALSFYLNLILQQLQFLAGRLTGAYADRLDFWLAWQLDPTPVIVAARALAAAAGAATAGVAATVGARVAGRPGAWLAGVLMAVSPLAVAQGRLVGPDVWVGLFAVLAVRGLLDAAAGGRLRHYLLAALWIGLGAAAEGRPWRLAGLDDRRPWLAALVCVAAFVAASPSTLADLDVLRRDVTAQGAHMGQGHFGQQEGSGLVHYVNATLPGALGWPAYLLGVAGLFFGRLRREVRVLAWCLLPLLLVLGSLGTRFDRYMLPVLPLLAAGAGAAWLVFALRWPALNRPPAVAVGVVLLAAWPAWRSAHEVAVQGRTSTRQAATVWLETHAAGRSVLTERYGPHLVPDPAVAYRGDPAFARLDPARRARLLDRPYHPHQVIPMYSVRTGAAAFYYDLRHVLAYDLVVTSGAVRGRYLADPERFAVQARFYAGLDRWAEPVFGAVPGPDLRGPEIRVHRVTDATRRAVREALGLPTADRLVAGREGTSAADHLAFLAAAAHHAALGERWQVAVPYAAAVRRLSDPAGRADATLRLAVAVFLSGDAAGARPLFAGITDDPAVGPAALGYLGVIAEQAGDPAEAARRYRQVIDRAPGSQAAALARRRLDALPGASGE